MALGALVALLSVVLIAAQDGSISGRLGWVGAAVGAALGLTGTAKLVFGVRS